ASFDPHRSLRMTRRRVSCLDCGCTYCGCKCVEMQRGAHSNGSNPDFLLGGRTSASAECGHWSKRAVRWSSCAILQAFSRLTNGCALGVGFLQLRTCRRTRSGAAMGAAEARNLFDD